MKVDGRAISGYNGEELLLKLPLKRLEANWCCATK